MKIDRPDIFSYNEHLTLLKDWVAYLRATRPKFSLRNLSTAAGLATGYLPMILKGQRSLTEAALTKLLPHLSLTPNEQSFLECLLMMAKADTHDARVVALDRAKRFGQFRQQNLQETAAYEYLSHWYYVAIREMATTPEFRDDPLWIQDRLSFQVSLKEIKATLDFLFQNHFLEKNPDGSVISPGHALDCQGGIYRVGLAHFHREIMRLAGEAIDQIPSEKRNILGHTCSLNAENYEKAREIAIDAIERIRQLGAVTSGDAVYHLEVALFPLTSKNARAS